MSPGLTGPVQVPMDWQDESNSERVTLGVMKLPARSKKNPLPPVFVNPGVCLSLWSSRQARADASALRDRAARVSAS